jgi:hypothetical protein
MRRGASWGEPVTGPADVRVRGSDADLAESVRMRPGALVELDPTTESDIARAVGIAGRAPGGALQLPFDVIDLDDDLLVVNAAILGVPPDRLGRRHRRARVVVRVDGRTRFDGRATTVVIATGQYLRGSDLVPRGHPGDGRIEVQVYGLAPGQRRAMRRRLATGTHVPHPDITEAAGRRVEVSVPTPWLLELDGRPSGAHGDLTATVRERAWRLVV